jgi:hypothetical protein
MGEGLTGGENKEQETGQEIFQKYECSMLKKRKLLDVEQCVT